MDRARSRSDYYVLVPIDRQFLSAERGIDMKL
jgi:hypothetical protein